jgi:hypothetical protein
MVRARTPILVALFALAALAVPFSSPAPVAADGYTWYESDYPKVSSGGAWLWQGQPQVAWYYDTTWTGTYYKGVLYNTYVVGDGSGGGCIFAKVDWLLVTGTVSWPPSAGSTSVSDGYYYSCRPSRNAEIPYLTLGNNTHDGSVRYTSRALYGVRITVCHATSIRSPKMCSSEKFLYGGN